MLRACDECGTSDAMLILAEDAEGVMHLVCGPCLKKLNRERRAALSVDDDETPF